MTGTTLRQSRQQEGWTQEHLAKRLGVTQAYLSLMECGRRRVPDHVARLVAEVLPLPATALPLRLTGAYDEPVEELWIEQGLARLDYPGLAYRAARGPRHNPAELLLRALALEDLDPRLVEALPWLLLQFERLDFDRLAALARADDLQNRLGFTVTLALQVAQRSHRFRGRVAKLRRLEALLERSRLAREDTYGRKETSDRMREYLQESRSQAAQHWNLLTDLRVEHLPYAADDSGTLAELSS